MAAGEIRSERYRLKAKAPAILRIFMLAALAAVVFAIIGAFVKSRNDPRFTLRPEEARLSKEVAAEVANYERTETTDGKPIYSVKADIAKTFVDEHQELSNAEFRFFGDDGEVRNTLTAGRVTYIPKADKDFTAYLRENVVITASDGFEVRSDSIVYQRGANKAESEVPVTFRRGSLTGGGERAILDLTAETLELSGGTEFRVEDSGGIRSASIRAASAVFDRVGSIATFSNSVNVSSVSADSAVTDISAPMVTGHFDAKDSAKIKPIRFDASGGVTIVSRSAGSVMSEVSAANATFDVEQEKFELSGSVAITTGAPSQRVAMTATYAIYQRTSGEFSLQNATVTRPGERLAGDKLDGKLYPNNSLKDIVIRGGANVKQENDDRAVEVSGVELNASFLENGPITRANAVNGVRLIVVPNKQAPYSRALLTATKGIGTIFRAGGELEKARADGSAKLVLEPPSAAPNGAVRTISAETIRTSLRPNGKDLAFAEAVGSAVLLIDPVASGDGVYQTVIRSPRMECDFYPSGNNARTCTAMTKAAAVRTPKFTAGSRGEQKMLADRFIAHFEGTGGQVEHIDAIGSARFSELDRNATAREFSFSQQDRIVKLRGGEPTVWDSRARAKAAEIDWDTKADRSYLRGRVSTTFYNVRGFGSAAPFSSGADPVFITSDAAEFDHANESGIYTGNARAWQLSNYVRADTLFIDQKNGRMKGEGSVRSQLSRVRIRRGGSIADSPVAASSGMVTYDRNERILRYRGNVDVRQGSDRLTAGSMDIVLNESGDVIRTVAENNVTITQPGRKALGNWALYDAVEETVVLRGDPASIADSEAGSTRSSEISYSMRDRRAVGKGTQGPGGGGRSRTVYRVKPGE